MEQATSPGAGPIGGACVCTEPRVQNPDPLQTCRLPWQFAEPLQAPESEVGVMYHSAAGGFSRHGPSPWTTLQYSSLPSSFNVLSSDGKPAPWISEHHRPPPIGPPPPPKHSEDYRAPLGHPSVPTGPGPNLAMLPDSESFGGNPDDSNVQP